MKKLILLFLISFMLSNADPATLYSTLNMGPVDITVIDTAGQAYIPFAMATIDSLRTAETPEPFLYGIHLENLYSLPDLPCVKLFQVQDGRVYEGGLADPYELFLFNKCDSSIYPFETGVVRFSKVVKQYLPEIIDKGQDAIYNLVLLYLNTLSEEDIYYIISSPDDYRKIWEASKWDDVYGKRCFTKDQVEADINSVERVISRFEMIKNEEGGYIRVGLTTWDRICGSFEYWEIQINDKVFYVHDRFIVSTRKGPYTSLY